jgi:hypothetical protein
VYVDYLWSTTLAELPVAGYRRRAETLTPDLPHITEHPIPLVHLTPQCSTSGQLRGIVEWWIIPLGSNRRRFIAVSWLALAAVGVVPAAIRATLSWWRWRKCRLPSFPVLPPVSHAR